MGKNYENSRYCVTGRHNFENILSAIAAAKLSGVPNEAIQEVLDTFTWCETSFAIC